VKKTHQTPKTDNPGAGGRGATRRRAIGGLPHLKTVSVLMPLGVKIKEVIGVDADGNLQVLEIVQ
jgi:hypothetical protein